VLDPNLDEWNISGDQYVFLQNTLDEYAPVVDNIHVFFHQLLWWSPDNIYQNITINSTEGRADSINFWSEIMPLFEALPHTTHMFAGDVGAYPSGDEFVYHAYNEHIYFVASGVGSLNRDNFVMVKTDVQKNITYELVALNGNDRSALGTLEDYELP
jgi:hypothetical protein